VNGKYASLPRWPCTTLILTVVPCGCKDEGFGGRVLNCIPYMMVFT
jgi:hypothetical protein